MARCKTLLYRWQLVLPSLQGSCSFFLQCMRAFSIVEEGSRVENSWQLVTRLPFCSEPAKFQQGLAKPVVYGRDWGAIRAIRFKIVHPQRALDVSQCFYPLCFGECDPYKPSKSRQAEPNLPNKVSEALRVGVALEGVPVYGSPCVTATEERGTLSWRTRPTGWMLHSALALHIPCRAFYILTVSASITTNLMVLCSIEITTIYFKHTSK